MADLAVPLRPLDEVVPGVFGQLPGWELATSDERLAAALIDAGARLIRHGHVYSRDLIADPPERAWSEPELGTLEVCALMESSESLVELLLAAYPLGHPDCETVDPDVVERDVRGLLDGTTMGPLMGVSSEVRDGAQTVAAVIVNRTEGGPPFGGPWVSDVCRAPGPAFSGLGSILLRRSMRLLFEGGAHSLSLAVTHGNTAQLTYERLRFVHVAAFKRVLIPT